MKGEHKSKTEMKTSTVKTRTETKSTRSIERKAQRTTITTSSVTEKKTDIKSSPTTPKKSVEHKVNGVAPKPEPMKHARPSSRTRPSPTSTPAKSAKEANNRKVVESKYHISKASKLTTSKAAKKEVQEPAAKAERKPVSRRPKATPSSPAKIAAKSPGSPAKSSSAKSTPTPSVKSEKEAVIRKRKVETGKITADSSAVSTPSTTEVETVVKAKEIGKAQDTPLVNGHISEMIITKEDISKELLDKPLEETYVEKKTEKIDSETIRKSPTDDQQEVTETEDKTSVREKEIKDIPTIEGKEKQMDEETVEKEVEVEEKEMVVEDKESEIEEKETELEEKESEIEEKESEVEEGDDSRQLIHEKEDVEATEEEQTEEIEDEEGPVDIKESLHAELETEVKKLMREKIEGGEEEEEEEEGGGTEEEEEEQEEEQEGDEDEEDEYLIVEKEDVESYQEQESIESHLPDDFDNKDIDVEEEDEGELQKHLLDEVETEKTKKDIEKEEMDTKMHREVESQKEHLIKEKEVDITLKSKAEKEITETEKMKEEHVEEIKEQETEGVTEETAKPLKEEITKDHIEEKVEEIISSAKEIVTKGKFEDERKPGVSQESDKDIQKEELSESKKEPETSEDLKEISSISPEEKIDVSSEKVRETTDTDHKLDDGGHEMKEIPSKEILEQKFIAEESQPDEKVSTTIESAATTAPTLPEDERIPLDEIKEIVEEKYVKEETKEKEKPVAEAVTRLEQPTTLPQVVMPIFETHIAHGIIHQRDIVKTPDEVADLPVHEEVDPGMYDADDFVRDFHKTKYEVQLSKKQQDTEEIKDYIPEVGAAEERLKIDTGKADTLKESLKQFEDEKEVEEVKIAPEERFVDEIEDIIHVKREISDVAKPSVKPVSVAQLEEPMPKEDMAKPTDESKPVTVISEEKLLEATFQTYADLKATKEKVDELKEKFSEEGKKAVEKEIDYAAILEKDIAHDRVALQEMREEKKTEGEEIGAEYISSEKKYIEEQLETISDQLKQKEKVISEEISTLQQTYVKEMPEVKGKDEMKPLPMDVAQEKMQEEKQKVITEDVTERIEKLEGDKVIQEKKIEKDIKEDVTAEIKEVEDKEKPVPKEMTQEVIMQDEKIISDELVKAKKVAEKDELITDDEEIKKLKEEEVVPKEVIEETIKDKEVSKVMCEEEMKEERVVKEDIIEEIKQLEGKEKSTPKEVLEKKIKEEDETISKAMIEVEEKEEKVDTEDIMAKIPKLEEKDKDVLKEVDDKEKSTQKDVAKDETKVGEEMGLEELVDVTKKREIVTEDTIAAIPKLEDKQKVSLEELDESKTKDKKEEEKEKRIAEEIKKDIVDLEEQEQLLSKDVAKEKPEDKQKEEIDKSLRELEDTEKLSPKEVKEIQISKEKIPEKDTEEQLIVAKYTTEETDKLKEKEKIQEREMVEDKAKEGRKIESEEIIHEKKKDEREVITKDITEKQEEKERLSPREVVEEITVKEEVSVSAEAIQREETIKADLTTEIKKQQEMEKIVSKELVEEKEKESEEKIKAITEDVALVMLKAEEKEKPAPKERAEEKMKEEKLVSKEAAEEDKREDKETVITEDIPEKIKQLEEKEKPAPTEISELKTKEETVVLKEKVVEKKADDRVITEDITKLEVKEKTPSDDRVEIKAEEEIITIKKVDEEKKEEEKAKVEVAGKRIVEEGADEEKDISQKMAEEKIEEKEKVVPEEITKEKKQLDATEKLVSKETSKTKSEDEVTRISKEIDQKMIIEDKKKIVPEITEHVKKQEERDTSLPKEEIEEMIQEEWEIVSKEMIEEEKKDSSEAVTEATVVEIKEAEEKEITIPKEIDKEKIKEPEKIITKDTIVKLEEHKVVTEDITEKLKETEKKEESVPHALPEEKAKEAEKPLLKETIVRKEEDKVITEHITEAEIKPEEKEETVPHEICEEKPKEADTVVKKEEEKVITEDITEEAKKPEEKDKTVPHEIPEDKIKEAEKLAPKETIAKKEEEKVITEDITEEVKKPEEKEKTFPFEILEEKAKEAEKPVSKDTVMKVEEEKVITEDITEEVKKPEEKEEFIPQEIPERKAKEAEKPVSKDTVVKEEEEKVVTEDITEEVKKPEEKEKTVSQELLEEKAKEAEKPVSKDTLVKEEEEKIVTEDITEEVKKPEEKEKSAPQEILEEKAKEAEKPVSKDTVVKEEEEKIVTEDITEEVKKPEEKEKSAPQEILEEKAKEAEKPVSKDTVVKEEEEKIVTEDITEEVKKPEEKEKSAPQEILEEKAKEAEKPVSKDTVVKEEEEKIITEDITEEVKKPEEKEKTVASEIPEEKTKEDAKPVSKDTVVKKEEEKVITEDVTEEVKKPEEQEGAVPHEKPEEKTKEAVKPVSEDTVLKKEEEKVITEDITEEVKKPEEKEKTVPSEIPKEKAKEDVKPVSKDTVVKKEEGKFVTEDVTEEMKKPEEKEETVPHEIPEEKAKEPEKPVSKDTVLMREKEEVITEDITEKVKKPEEKEEAVPHEIPKEKAKEVEKPVLKDTTVTKEEEKVITDYISEEVKKPEDKEEAVPHEIPKEKAKEAEKPVSKDTVLKKEEEKVITEDITEVKKPEEKEKPVPYEIVEEKSKEVGKADLKDTTEKIKEDRSQDLEKEKLISKDIDEQYIVSPEKGEEGKKPSLGDMPSSEEFVEERRKVEEKSSTPEITEKKDDVKDVPLSEKMVEKERYISEDLLEEKKEGEEKEEVVPKDLIKEGEKVDTIHIDHTEKEKEIDEREKTITEKIIEEKKKEVGEESIIVKDSVEHEKKGEPIAVEDITSVIGKEEPKKDKAASKELLEEKKEEKGRERAITDISKEKEGQQETEKITSKQLIEKVGMEETTAKLAPKYVVAEKEKDQVISKAVTEEKIDDLEKRKIVTTYEKISDKIETIFDIKTDLSLQETSQPTATTAKEVKPAEVIKTNGELEKSEQKVPQVKMHGETAIKGEPEDKVDQKMEPGKETITAPSALSATYLEIIDKLQKEEPSEVDKQEDEESPKREELQVSEADKSLRKEVSKTMEELEEISVTSSQMSDIKHLSQEGVKPEITKDSHRKEEEQMSEEKPSLQEQELISKKDKAEIGVEKEDKKVKVEADSLETEKTSATIEWLTCVVKDTKPSLGEEQEEIFKKVVSTKEKKVTETEDQIDEKKVKEKQQEIEKTVKDTDIMSVITERQKTLPDSETSKEIPTSIEQKKQPTGEREIIDKSIEVVKSQPKYEADRPAETFSEVYQEDKKDELAKSVSSEKEKQLTDEEEKKQKTERLLLETEGSIISKDLAETITTTVMKEYILKTTHITSDSVTSDVPAPGKIPVQPSVEPEITPLQEKVEIKETGLSPKVEDTDKRAADTLISHELKDTEKISAGQEIGKEKQLGISEETTVSKVKEVSKEVKYDGITSKLPTSAADHRSDDEDGEPPPSPGEEYIDSGMEEEPVYTKLDAPELPEYVTVTPDSTPASPKALPLRPQDDSAKMHLPGSEEKERKEKLKYEHTETDKKEPAKVTTTALPQEKEVEYRMYVDDTGDKTGEPGEVIADEDGHIVTRRTRTEYKTIVTREGKPDEKTVSSLMAGSVTPISSGEITGVKDDKLSDEEHLEEIDDDSKESVSEETFTDEDGKTVTRKIVRRYKTVVTSRTESAEEKGIMKEIQPSFSSEAGPGSFIPVSSGEITTYTTVVKGDRLSDEEHLEEIDDDSKESVSEETFTDEDGKIVTRKVVRRYKTVVTSRTESADEKGEIKEFQPPFSSEAGPMVLPSSSKTTTTTTKVIEGHEYPLDTDKQDDKAAVSEETFTDKDGKTVTRRTVRHYRTYITQSTGEMEPTHIKTDDRTPLEPAQDVDESKTRVTVSTDKAGTEEIMEFDDDDEKESVTEETFTDEEGRTVTRRVIRRYKTVITKEREVVDEKPTTKLVTTIATKKTETKEGDDIDDGVEMEECTELSDQDEKESVSEETFTDESGKTVTRKIVRRYKTVVTRGSESVDTKDSIKLPPKEAKGIVDEIETEQADLDDQDEKESVTEETFTDESGRTVTRKVVRRYKTVMTKESSSVGTEESSQVRATDIIHSELSPTALTQKMYTTVIKSDDDRDDGVETDKLDELDDQDEKESVSEETFTDESGKTVTRKIVRRYKTVVTKGSESIGTKDTTKLTPKVAKSIGDETETERTDLDDQDEKESVTEETFTDGSGRTVTRKIVRRYKTVVTKESSSVGAEDSRQIRATDITASELSPDVLTQKTYTTVIKSDDDRDDGVETDKLDEFDDQDEKESVSEETFTDESGKTVTRKIVRRYKTVVTRGSESVDTKDSMKLAPKEAKDIVDEIETEQDELDDQDEKESVTEETFTDENGRVVTRKIVRRYKTVITKESSSVDAEDSSQMRATDTIASELSPTVLTRKTYTTVIKSDDDRDDGVETDKLEEFDDQDENESVSEETFTDEGGRTVRRKIIRHYKTVIRQEGEPTDAKDSTTIKMEKISAPDLTLTATTSESCMTDVKEGVGVDDGIEISDQDGKESVTEETFTDENGRIVTRKIVRRYKTVVTKESGSLEDKGTSETEKKDVRDMERMSTAFTTDTHTTALGVIERDELTDFDDQDERESVSEETFTDEDGRTVTRKIVRRYKTVVTKESELPDEKDTSQLTKVLGTGSELPTTTILRKIYTTVTKDGEGTKDGLETEQLDELDDQDGKESVTEETFTDEHGRTVTRKIVKRYKTVVTTEGEDVIGDISSDGKKETDDDDSKDSVTEETFTDEEGRTVRRKIVKHYKTTVLKTDDITDKTLSTTELQFDPDAKEKSIAFSSFTTAEGKSDTPLDFTEGEDGKDSIIEETFTGEDGSVVTRKITRQYKTILKQETGSDDHHFTTKISTGSADSSLPLTTTTMTKTYTTVTKQGDDYGDDFSEDLGKAHEPSGATSKTTTTVTTITKRISSKDGEEEITEATTEEVTSEDGKEQSTVTVTTKRDEHGDMVVHTSITPRDKELDGYSIAGPVSFIGSDKGEHSAHSTVSTTVTTSQMTTDAWKTGRKHDSQQCDSDEEDDPTSPLSITSQLAHSPPSHFGFETSASPTASVELYSPKVIPSQKVSSTQMTSSFYGSLPSGEEQLTSTDEKLDFQRALHEHREARGEDLQSSFHSPPVHKTVTMGYKEGLLHGEQLSSGINGQKHEDIDSKGATTKSIPSSSGVSATSQKIPPVVTSAHLPAEHGQSAQKDTKGDKQKDPIGSWGKPLGLPAPAPPPANTITTNGEVNTATKPGTPKKEKKAMQMKKNLVMNENNKAANAQSAKESKSRRSESPVKQKNVSNKDVGKNTKVPGGHIYIDLTYVPHHGNSYYTNVEFFKKVRARYYVFSGTEPSRDVYNALLEAKQTWEDKDLEVTIIPTYDTDTLGYWVAENEDLLTKYKIDLSPSASRCTINLQDHETSCSAYRLEF
ncbi:microtubule-associated protein futsch-like isoform X6 [Schistocerca cancellata]|uniref:microtubule-associated protein futsch-like isoform X6 n=1 Tax=Schistocerca cancellata TaxID=274614 RepID=UPI00211920F9|nr:microtubule-associated protein futsch-like isoform X6 [Schistocerca cancellata]